MTHTGIPLLLSQQIRRLEQQAADANLMQKAAAAIAALARELVGDNSDPVLVVAGPGNNGGDALLAALSLKSDWQQVVVVLPADPQLLPAEAASAYTAWTAAGGSVTTAIPDMRFSLAIDGLFSIGLQRPLQGSYAELVEQINSLDCPVLAIDIPSGLHADSGRVLGCAVTATHTLTLLANKPGLYTLDGPDHAGHVHFDDLGIDLRDTQNQGSLTTAGSLPALTRRKLNSHKGLFGDITVLGGSTGMSGAVLLAARAALYCGSGRVYGGFVGETPMVDLQQPELMLRPAGSIAALSKLDCGVIGPGLGQSQDAVELLEHWLAQEIPLVLDADALNGLAAQAQLKHAMQQRHAPAIITPHPLEASRLLDCSSGDIQHDRIAAALQLARQFNAVCVLKGVGSVCAAPDGHWHINTSGNPGLASAGTGDVLAGILGSLLGQGLSALDAARLGVYLHGAAADTLVENGIGPAGLTASELLPAVRRLINQHSRNG